MIDYEAALSPRVKGIAPSGIRKFFDLLENMESGDAISLGVGEPDFVTPWHIRDAGVYALEKGFTKYTSNAGLKELRGEISKYLHRRFAAPPFASLRSAPVPPLNVPRVAVVLGG